ncbi:efflux transporter outer membrane subunit [Acetobacter sp. DsW_063]|uniref:efflux transporter outer membrane subunit n=1 Tax=Acetobacter sp. DsW_063 TaxID=1514894 RepID=UPI003516E77B
MIDSPSKLSMRRHGARKAGVIGFSAALLSACTMIPDYHRTAPPMATTYPTDPMTAVGGTASPGAINREAWRIGWEEFFTDPRLRALIAIAIRENRDLRQAAGSIEQASGEYDVQHATLLPPIGATGEGMYLSPSRTAGLSFAPGQGRTLSMFRYYSAGIGFSSYEIDFFGRIRSLSRSAGEKALAQVANQRSVLISTVSQVANAYIAWLGARELAEVAQNTWQSQAETYRLTKLRFDRGEADMLTLRQTEEQVAQSASLRDDALRQEAQDENALVLLIGAPIPANLPPPGKLGEQTLLADIPAGLPSDLLDRRPDIEQAEHTLLSANADIGAARAAFFPKISLTATDGLSSLQFHSLFTSAATTWGFTPQISIPLFTWGQASGNLHTAKGERAVDLAAYQKTVQSAFKEVSDALVARGTYLDEAKQAKQLVEASNEAFHLAKLRFSTGSDSYLTTLQSQRDYLQAQQSRIQVDVLKYQNLVTVYRALGGGWSQHSVPDQNNGKPVTPKDTGLPGPGASMSSKGLLTP